MIVTLTPNPSVDRAVMLAGPLLRGQVQRVASEVNQGGGKGVNISRAAVIAGQPSIAVLPASKDDPFVHELLAAGIDCRPSAPAGEVRINLTITEPDGTTTKLNSPGASVTGRELDDMKRLLLTYADRADWVVLAGSTLPAHPSSGTPIWSSRCVRPRSRSRSIPARPPWPRWSRLCRRPPRI